MIPKIIPTGIYQHYKQSLRPDGLKGNYYLVLGVARHSETEELFVVYIPLYNNPEYKGPKMTVRPAEMFFEKVLVNGKKVPRFKYIGNELK